MGRTGVAATSAGTAVLVLEVGAHRCGVPLGVVRELHRMVATVPLPQAPPVIEGVIDVRGEVVPVLDLRARLGLARVAPRPSQHLVVVDAGERTMALRADRALDVVTLDDDAGTVGSLPGAELAGVGRLDDGLLLIHDVQVFLSRQEEADLDAALTELGRSAV